MTTTPNYGLKKPDESDYYDVGETFNKNADIIDTELAKAQAHRNAANPHSGSEGLLKAVDSKSSLVDADAIVITDSAASGNTKRVLWGSVKSMLSTVFNAVYAGKMHASSHASGGSDALTSAAIGAEADMGTLASKGAMNAADSVVMIDSESNNARKKVLWSNIAALFIPASAKAVASGVATLDASVKVLPAQASAAITTSSGALTLALTHAGRFLNMTNAAAVTITVPANATVAFPTGTEIEVCRYGAGTITFAAASGVTVLSADNAKAIDAQYGCAVLKKLDTNVWLLAGLLG